MTDPTVAYPPPNAGRWEEGQLPPCCEHVPNLHDRTHCLAAGCECTREGYILSRQRAAIEAMRQAAPQPAEDQPVPDGYEEFRLSFPVCPGCGCLVGDTTKHDEFVARGGHRG